MIYTWEALTSFFFFYLNTDICRRGCIPLGCSTHSHTEPWIHLTSNRRNRKNYSRALLFRASQLRNSFDVRVNPTDKTLATKRMGFRGFGRRNSSWNAYLYA